MRLFLQNCLLFIFGILVYFLLMGIVNYTLLQQLPPNVAPSEILIIGDSHTEVSLNPALFKSCQNVSMSAEPIILTFWKLKKIVPIVLPTKVVVSFSPHNITNFNDLRFSHKKWADEMFSRSYAVQNYKSLTSIEVDYLQLMKTLWKYCCLFPNWQHNQKYIGYFKDLDRNNLDELDERIQRHYHFSPKGVGLSETSIQHLDSIVHFCQKKNIELILLSTPVHPAYFAKIPPSILSRFEAEKKRFQQKGVKVIDEMQYSLPDSLYADFDHLNGKGAAIFTKKMKQTIE